MNDSEKQKMQVELVFGLTGGELSDQPWEVDADKREMELPYWYDGVPEYAVAEMQALTFERDVRTVVFVEALWGTPELLKDRDTGELWRKLATWTSSGEAECLCAGEDSPPRPCPLCEAEDGEPGFVYLGEGCCEVAYIKDTTKDEEDE